MEKIPMTAAGHAALQEEIRHLKTVERPRIIKAIAEARAHGDLSENAEYHGDKVQFGATVTLVDEDTDKEVTYQIVGDFEADVSKGKISISSPIARALIGKEVGDSVEVNTPGGGKSYEILSVEYK